MIVVKVSGGCGNYSSVLVVVEVLIDFKNSSSGNRF